VRWPIFCSRGAMGFGNHKRHLDEACRCHKRRRSRAGKTHCDGTVTPTVKSHCRTRGRRAAYRTAGTRRRLAIARNEPADVGLTGVSLCWTAHAVTRAHCLRSLAFPVQARARARASHAHHALLCTHPTVAYLSLRPPPLLAAAARLAQTKTPGSLGDIL
jgi:hypothetical protein